MPKLTDDAIIARALRLLEDRAKYGDAMSSPGVVKDYLRLKLSALEHEEFHCVWLTSQHQVIRIDAMFRGTINQTSVHPREVVKAALSANAAAVIFAHNHPSGSPTPSRADELLTTALKSALALVDVRVLDHMIVAGSEVSSFAERGLL